MCGFGLEFSNGVKTGFFETANSKSSNFELERIVIDTRKTIKRVCMQVTPGSQLKGLRLIDDEGCFLVDVTWDLKHGFKKWVNNDIPEGKAIVGIKAVTNASHNEI